MTVVPGLISSASFCANSVRIPTFAVSSVGVGSKARFVAREETQGGDRYLDYAEGKTRQFKPGSFARAGALPIAVPVTAGNPRPVPIIMVVVVISIIMAVVAV